MTFKMSFTDYLEEFGFTKAEFARLIGVSPETVVRWKEEPPRVVMMLLEERRASRELLEAIRDLLRERQ